MYLLLLFWSVHDLVCMRPSIITKPPLLRYWFAISPNRPHATMVWNSVASFLLPDGSFQTRFVAIRKVATLWPLGVDLNSGSCVNLPIKNTLFRFIPYEVAVSQLYT